MMTFVKRELFYHKRQIMTIEVLGLIFLTLIVAVSGKNTALPCEYLITDIVSPNILLAVTGLFSNFVFSLFQHKNDYFSFIRIGRDRRFKGLISLMILIVASTSFLVAVFYQIGLWIEWKTFAFYPISFALSWLQSSALVLIIELIISLISIVFTKISLIYFGSFVFVALSMATSTAKGMQIFGDVTGVNYLVRGYNNLTMSYLLIAGGIIILLVFLERRLFGMKEIK